MGLRAVKTRNVETDELPSRLARLEVRQQPLAEGGSHDFDGAIIIDDDKVRRPVVEGVGIEVRIAVFGEGAELGGQVLIGPERRGPRAFSRSPFGGRKEVVGGQGIGSI